jgi:hypothetical protein
LPIAFLLLCLPVLAICIIRKRKKAQDLDAFASTDTRHIDLTNVKFMDDDKDKTAEDNDDDYNQEKINLLANADE